MSSYGIISELKLNYPIIEQSIIDNINTQIKNLSIYANILKIFADSDLHDVSWDDNLEQFYNSTNIVDNFIWRIDHEKVYSNLLSDNNYPLSTLNYILNNILVGEYSVSGSIILYNINTQDDEEYKCIVYNVDNSIMRYHLNKSMDLTKHWSNINCFLDYEDEIEDEYSLPSSFVKYTSNSFENLLYNCFPSSVNNYNSLFYITEDDMFKFTYTFVCL